MLGYWWVPLGLASMLLAYYLLTVVLGMLLPPAFTGKLLLRKLLKQKGVDPQLIPTRCLVELTQGAIKVSNFVVMSGRSKFQSALCDSLEGVACYVQGYLFTNMPISENEELAATLRRYGVERIYLGKVSEHE